MWRPCRAVTYDHHLAAGRALVRRPLDEVKATHGVPAVAHGPVFVSGRQDVRAVRTPARRAQRGVRGGACAVGAGRQLLWVPLLPAKG